MGEHTDWIFVRKPKNRSIEEILKKLNLDEFKAAEQVPLHHADSRFPDLFCGLFNENLLIAHPDFASQFMTESLSPLEKSFISIFPDTEISAIVVNGTSDYYAYAVIENGRKVRVKEAADNQFYTDFGELLPEEKELLSEPPNGYLLRDLQEEGCSEEKIKTILEFDAYAGMIGRLTKRYLGEEINKIDTDKVLITRYSSPRTEKKKFF